MIVLSKEIFMSKSSNFSIVLEPGRKIVKETGVIRTPTKRAQFKNGVFDPYKADFDMEPEKIIKKMVADSAYNKYYWLIDTSNIITVDKLLEAGIRDLKGKDGMVADVDDPKMLREAIEKENAKSEDRRSTAIELFKLRLNEILEEYNKIGE